MDKLWYVIEAYEGKEQDVYLRLANAQLNVWRPIDVVRPSCRRSNKRTTVEIRPRRISRFGRFIFLNAIMTESLFHAVRNTTNVKRVVCNAGTSTPSVIGEDLIKFYKYNKPDKVNDEIEFKVGKSVVIEKGPLENTAATIKSVFQNRVLELELPAHNNNSARIVIESANVRLC